MDDNEISQSEGRNEVIGAGPDNAAMCIDATEQTIDGISGSIDAIKSG